MAKKKKEDKYKDNGITYLEVWDMDMRVYRYKLGPDGNFIEKDKD